jgi:hypothetical protein
MWGIETGRNGGQIDDHILGAPPPILGGPQRFECALHLRE